MKKQASSILLACSCFTFILTGCGNNEGATGLGRQQDDLLRGYAQPNRHFVINRQANTDMDHYLRFGFGRHTEETAYSGQSVPEFAVYDRALMAETISKLTAMLETVNEVAVLVTDQHVLVAYDTDEADREQVATQVRKTAYSVVPAYYDVYAADEPRLMQDIERFQGLSPRDQDYVQTLEVTIEEMKKYPQGERINIDDPLLKDTRYDTTHQRSTQGLNRGMNQGNTHTNQQSRTGGNRQVPAQ